MERTARRAPLYTSPTHPPSSLRETFFCGFRLSVRASADRLLSPGSRESPLELRALTR